MTNLNSILESRDITLPTKVHLVKAMIFPVVIYGYLSWTLKKAEHRRTDAFELCCWRRLLRVPWTARRSNQSILKEISPGCSLAGLMLKLKLWYFGHLMRRADSFEKTLRGRSQDGGGIGRGDHFLFYKFIERTERWRKFTKQLLIASSGHQAPRKAAHCLRRQGKKNLFFFFLSFFLFVLFFFGVVSLLFFFFSLLFFSFFFLFFCLLFSPISF